MVKFEMGRTKKTKNQLKKHFSSITDNERSYLFNIIYKNLLKGKKIELSKHLSEKQRNNEVKLNFEAIYDCVNNIHSTLIEYNEVVTSTYQSRRVVLRSQYAYNVLVDDLSVLSNLIIVLDVDSLELVTAYNNDVLDNHTTMDITRYNNNLKIIK